MTDITAEKWGKVFADKEYATSILKMTPQEAKASLLERGYEFSDEEMAECAETLNELVKHIDANGELEENFLAEVAGGGHLGSFFGGVAAVVGAGIVGLAIGLGW